LADVEAADAKFYQRQKREREQEEEELKRYEQKIWAEELSGGVEEKQQLSGEANKMHSTTLSQPQSI
jgi:hypothetical protein